MARPAQNYNKNILAFRPSIRITRRARPSGLGGGLTVFALEVPTFIMGGEVATHWDSGFNFDNLPFDWTRQRHLSR